MTFIKTSLALSLGVTALCLSVQAGAARTAPDFATVVKADVASQAAESASAPRQMLAEILLSVKPAAGSIASDLASVQNVNVNARSTPSPKMDLSTPDIRPVVPQGIQSQSASGPVLAAKTKSKNSQYQNSGSTVTKGRGPNAR